MGTDTIIPGPGYLAPVATNNEKNDKELNRFLTTLVAGIVGLPGNLVRPRWQPEPPNQPALDVDWAAVGEVGQRERDTFAANIQVGDLDDGQTIVIRNEIINILCSFYGPNAQRNTDLLANGVFLPQNREAMELNGFGLVEIQASLPVPALIKDRWVYGMDTAMRLRRQQQYTYSGPNLKEAKGTVQAENFAVAFDAKQQP